MLSSQSWNATVSNNPSAISRRRPGGTGTWITPEMALAYERLFELGYAHCCEAWQDGALVGGVYGVSLGKAFFAESMFHRVRDASKAAFAALLWQLGAWGFDLFDGQLPTPHLASLGLRAWPRERFLRALAVSVARPTRRGRWKLDAEVVRERLAAGTQGAGAPGIG